MSGPKTIVVPPRYSATAFSGQLEALFSAQAKLRQLATSLSQLRVSNKLYEIDDSAQQWQHSHRDELAHALLPYTLDVPTSFDQTVFNRVTAQIRAHLARVSALADSASQEQTRLTDIADDLQTLVDMEEYWRNTSSSFDTYQSSVCSFLSEALSVEKTKDSAALIRSLRKVAPEAPQWKFRPGLRNQRTKMRNEADVAIALALNKMDNLRQQTPAIQKRKPNSSTPVRTQEWNDLAETSRKEIASFPDPSSAAALMQRLENLQKSAVFLDPYYLKELLRDVRKGKDAMIQKARIHQILTTLDTETPTRPDNPTHDLRTWATTLAQSVHPKAEHVDDLDARVRRYLTEKQDEAQKADVARREREFLKAQLTLGLSRLGYCVENNGDVIDFNECSEVLLRTPTGHDFVTLRFDDESGRIAYNFWVDQLGGGVEAEQKARESMQRSCDAFGSVLTALNNVGIRLPTQRQVATHQAHLLQLPSRLKLRLAAPTTRQVITVPATHKIQNRGEE